MLADQDMLRVGSNHTATFWDCVPVTTMLAGKRTTCRLGTGKNALTLSLESRRLGGGLVWYFKDPESRKLCTKIYFNGKKFGSRETVGAVYVSQYGDKTLAKLLSIDKQVHAIKGNPDSNISPARGKRKSAIVERLERDLSELVSNPKPLEKILERGAYLERITDDAIAILRLELPTLSKKFLDFERLRKKIRKSDDDDQH
jgi:hypothetical protein